MPFFSIVLRVQLERDLVVASGLLVGVCGFSS